MNRAHPFSLNPLAIAQAAAAVHDAERELADTFCAWPVLSHHARPVALKFAVLDLVTVFLSEPVRAEVWLSGLAKMMQVTKSDLLRLVRRRADIVAHLPELLQTRRAQTEGEIIKWIL